MFEFLHMISNNAGIVISGIVLFFMFTDWVLEKVDLHIEEQRRQKREFYEKWKTIRKHF